LPLSIFVDTHDAVKAAESRCGRTDMLGIAVAKHLDGKARTRVIAGQELPQVRAKLRQSEEAGRATQQMYEL
jgi:hypothetical protein